MFQVRDFENRLKALHRQPQGRNREQWFMKSHRSFFAAPSGFVSANTRVRVVDAPAAARVAENHVAAAAASGPRQTNRPTPVRHCA